MKDVFMKDVQIVNIMIVVENLNLMNIYYVNIFNHYHLKRRRTMMPYKTTSKDFDKAIQEAMKQEKISKKRAMSELLMFFVSHGTVDEFKDVINYFIAHQREEDDD